MATVFHGDMSMEFGITSFHSPCCLDLVTSLGMCRVIFCSPVVLGGTPYRKGMLLVIRGALGMNPARVHLHKKLKHIKYSRECSFFPYLTFSVST